MIIGHVFPNLGTSVVGSTSLRTEHTPLCNFGHIKITEFDDTFFSQEQICTLYVSVANF